MRGLYPQYVSKTLVRYLRPTGRGRSNKPALLKRVNPSGQGCPGREVSEAGTYAAEIAALKADPARQRLPALKSAGSA